MKYLELVKGQFTADHEARAKQEEPYVAYSEEADAVMYNFIPESIEESSNGEIWYTTVDGLGLNYALSSSVINGGYPVLFINSEILLNVYSNGLGKLILSDPVTLLRGLNINPSGSMYVQGPFGSCRIVLDPFVTEESNIKTITLPKTITQLDGYVFIGCTQLESIEFLGTAEEWNNIPKDLDKLTVARYDWSVEGLIVRIPATVVHCTDDDVTLS